MFLIRKSLISSLQKSKTVFEIQSQQKLQRKSIRYFSTTSTTNNNNTKNQSIITELSGKNPNTSINQNKHTTHNNNGHSSQSSSTTTATKTTTIKETFYKRQLPESLIQFTSEKGKELFTRSLGDGFLENYFVLAENFHTQNDPAYCGLSTMAMSLNALKIDPQRTWKHPWRWFTEDLLECCLPLEEVRRIGITTLEFECLARCNGAQIDHFTINESSVDAFREHIIECCSIAGHFLIVSFSRSSLQQTGDGHFSPVAAYDRVTDSVLLLDVAKFKYPAYWVPVSQLYDSMKPIDKITGQPRGYFIMKNPGTVCHIHTPLSAENQRIFLEVCNGLAHLETTAATTSSNSQQTNTANTTNMNVHDFLSFIISQYSIDMSKVVSDSSNSESLLEACEKIPLFPEIKQILNTNDSKLASKIGLFLLALPAITFRTIPLSTRVAFHKLRDFENFPKELRRKLFELRFAMLHSLHTCTNTHCVVNKRKTTNYVGGGEKMASSLN